MIPKGFKYSGVRCGLKNKRNDVGILLSQVPARAAGVFTQNVVHASSVDFSRSAVADGSLRAIVVNSGNANCCTGEQGERDTRQMAALAASALGLSVDEIAVASTGVIGQVLNMSKVEHGIADAAKSFSDDPRPFMDAILTTDLVEKWALCAVGATDVYSPATPAVPVGNAGPVVYGVSKGSGMIAPNMATMLGFIATDADVSGLDLDAILRRAVGTSFNCLTVDGDTSTNDMVLVMANGAAGAVDAVAFEAALTAVCLSLAKQIARDGEGATKLVEVTVRGSADPKRIARTIAESPLVKTAMFGCDPNWGRIMMAAGRAGVPFDPQASRLVVGAAGEDHLLFEDGTPAAFDAKHVSTALKSDYVRLFLDLGEGETATIYTCDFGYGYVRINAEYHT